MASPASGRAPGAPRGTSQPDRPLTHFAADFEFDEATTADLQRRIAAGELTSGDLVRAYLDRIEEL
ncbi:MAG: amidase, partial [Gemmatimonadetes bacterium]|nr:amidase [Gemmatimonadota bacterium]